MTPDSLSLVLKVLQPVLGGTAQLIADLVSGAKSYATAKMEMGSILTIAAQRLESADTQFAVRDKAEDERVKDESTKP